MAIAVGTLLALQREIYKGKIHFTLMYYSTGLHTGKKGGICEINIQCVQGNILTIEEISHMKVISLYFDYQKVWLGDKVICRLYTKNGHV